MTSSIPDSEQEPFLPEDGNVKMRKGNVFQKGKKKNVSVVSNGTVPPPRRSRRTYPHAQRWMTMKYLWVLIFILVIVAGNYYHGVRRMKIIQKLAVIPKDYSEISGLQSLTEASKALKDRCFPHMKSQCSCPDPLTPSGRFGKRHWLKTTHENKDAIHNLNSDVDVVFYGDSITEGWKGTSFGFPNGRKDKNLAVYEQLFTMKGGAKYIGIPLGISGDRVSFLISFFFIHGIMYCFVYYVLSFML
jgi:hypothetical protein